jgi:hypothetical protein
MSLSSLIDPLRRAEWLDRDRIVAWGTALLGIEMAFAVFIALWQHGAFFVVENPTSSDFVSFFAAGKLALSGTPALAYDQAAHYAVQQQASMPGAPYQFFFYPPVFLFLCAVFAVLPYFLAYAAIQIASLGFFLWVMRAILRESGRAWLFPVLAFPAVFWTVGLGQNAFLTAGLFGAFTLLLDRRPLLAGIVLGLLCYKPHFGMLVPVALLAGGYWRSFLSAAATVIGLVGLSVALFGWETWQVYFHAFSGSGQVYQSGRIDLAGMVTVFGAMRLNGFSAELAYGMQGASAVAMAALVALIWRRCPGQPARFASLAAATLLAVPLALLYDQMLLLVAGAWLIRDGRANGFLGWEKIALLATYPLVLLLWPLGTGWHLPLGPVLSLAVLALGLRRLWPAVLGRSATTTAPDPSFAVGATR